MDVHDDDIQSAEGDALRQGLRDNTQRLAEALSLAPPPAAILPIILGHERDALEASAKLAEDGFLIPAIRFPTVARGSARLRVTLSSAHTDEDIAALADALGGYC